MTGNKIRNLVSNELRNRNRGNIAASYSGQTPENTLLEKNLKSDLPLLRQIGKDYSMMKAKETRK